MRVNVCVNGTFRYPDYIRLYAEAGALGRFHFAHRKARTAWRLGLEAGQSHNVWPKHLLHAAAYRAIPGRWGDLLTDRLCDGWQSAVLRHWRPADSLEAVIGGLADRVIARAVSDGVPVLGHPVTSHPAVFRERVAAARAGLGLPPEPHQPRDAARRAAEIAGCTALLADSHLVARSFIAHGVPAERIAVVRPGFDPRRFHPRAPEMIDPREFLVACVGLVTPRKGQHVLLRAWRKLALPGARLLLIGSPGRDGRAMLRGLPDSVTHLGHIEQAELRAVMARAACVVLPSAEDGFGQAALEAMACGLPVIVSDAVGAAELVRPGHSGFVVPALDTDALASAIERLYRDRTLVIAMGRAAVADAARASSWSSHVAQVLAIHRRLIQRLPLLAEGAAA